MEYTPAINPNFGRLGVETSRLWPETNIIEKKGKTKDTLGLAMSGGGYRSAIFNYGMLAGLREIGVLQKVDYMSVVSGGSWIGTPYAMAETPDRFFQFDKSSANVMEESFESLLVNPIRLAEEAALTRTDDNDESNNNYLSDLFGRLLARTFLREHGDFSRFKPLSDGSLIQDSDRPFLIINGSVNFRRPDSFHVTQECFEMTRLYCGSRSLGYIDTQKLKADRKGIRIRDAIAISGAAAAFHVPGLGAEVAGFGLSREIENYAKDQPTAPAGIPQANRLDIADGGFYNNLGVESLVNRGCGYIIVVDAEHDPENKRGTRSFQSYHGLNTLLQRNNVQLPGIVQDKLDHADEAVHVITGNPKVPDVLYVKLKSLSAFNKAAAKEKYNQPGFLRSLFTRGDFSFDPQFSTAKLDYSFAEHRNLSELGRFIVKQNAKTFLDFASKSR